MTDIWAGKSSCFCQVKLFLQKDAKVLKMGVRHHGGEWKPVYVTIDVKVIVPHAFKPIKTVTGGDQPEMPLLPICSY